MPVKTARRRKSKRNQWTRIKGHKRTKSGAVPEESEEEPDFVIELGTDYNDHSNITRMLDCADELLNSADDVREATPDGSADISSSNQEERVWFIETEDRDSSLFRDDIIITRIMEERAIELHDEWIDLHSTLIGLIIQEKEFLDDDQPVPDLLREGIEAEMRRLQDVYDNNTEQPFAEDSQAAKVSEIVFDWDNAAPNARPEQPISMEQAPPRPKGIREALAGPFKRYFLAAMKAEMEALLDEHHVYETVPITDVPTGKRIIPCHWVFDYKTNPDGFIERFKARLVADGNRQVEFEDYFDTNSPVVRVKAVRILLAMSAVLGMHVELADVDTAYLNANLPETTYMHLPRGFETFDDKGRPEVAHLKRALYGLHQSGRAWYFKLTETLKDCGFTQSHSEPCAFRRICSRTKHPVIVLIYVDDMIIASTSKEAVRIFKDEIQDSFAIKDITDDNWILKVQVEHVKGGTWIGLPMYTKKIIAASHRWDTDPSKWRETPMVATWTHDPKSPPVDERQSAWYVSVLAQLMYLGQMTRPDILYAVNTLAQFQRGDKEQVETIFYRGPRLVHMRALVHILDYLRGTYDLGIFYQISSANTPIIVVPSEWDQTTISTVEPLIEGYADASYGREYDRRSRSAYVFMAFGGPVSWYSKKQMTTAQSSTEAELLALAEGVKEAIWMKEFISELGFTQTMATTIHEDNMSVIAIAKNPIHHGRVKHVEIKTSFIRENIQAESIKLVYCPTELMIADLFTKPLLAGQHVALVERMGMRRLSKLRAGTAQRAYLHIDF